MLRTVLKSGVKFLIALVTLINPAFLEVLDFGEFPTENQIDMSKFTDEPVWQDEFDGTEVDIFESMYYKDYWWGNDAVISGLVYDGYGPHTGNASIGKVYMDGDPYREYHTYGLEWNENEYIFYVDGFETGRLTDGGVSQNPEYLLLSCEFAGSNGVQESDRHGTGEISKTLEENWPAEFIVDYVRCYQYKDKVN